MMMMMMVVGGVVLMAVMVLMVTVIESDFGGDTLGVFLLNTQGGIFLTSDDDVDGCCNDEGVVVIAV